jgi:hypothetical protein
MIYSRSLIDLISTDWKFVKIRSIVKRPMIEWCEKHPSEGYYTFGNETFFFSEEEDAVLFALKWL